MSREQAQAILLGMAVSGHCRSIRRAALMGYCYQNQPEQLRKIASLNTVFLSTAYLVKLALDGIHPRQWLTQLFQFTVDISDEWEAALLRIGHVEGWVDRQAALRHLNKHGTDEEGVTVALYGLRQFPDDFAAAIELANNSHHAVTRCLVGGISAARLGLEAIPADWLARCRNQDRLLRLGTKLAEKR